MRAAGRLLVGLACGLGLLVAPVACPAQPAAKVARVGSLWLHSGPSSLGDAFRVGLRDLGWVEGQNLAYEQRSADGKPERLADLAAELVRLKVDVIFATNTPITQAARKATTTIPIVFAGVADPLGVGLVANLGRPGGNVTGVSTISVELSAKRLELFRAAVPGLSRVAAFVNPASPQAPALLRETESAARSLGLELRVVEVRRPLDFERAFAAIGREPGAGLLVLPDPMYFPQESQARIAELAAKRRVPAMYFMRELVEAGGLMAYGANYREMGRRAATFVDRILKGAKPADLPVEQPTTFELVVNLRAARALGLSVPPSLLRRADDVIR